MHDHIASNKQHPTQNCHKISKILKNPQKFQRKPKNIGLMREMHEKRGFRSPYIKIEAWLGRNLVGNGDFRERKEFGRREKEFMSREKWKGEFDFVLKVFKEITSRWIEDRDLLSTKSQQIWIYRGAVENLLTAKVPWWIEISVENLSARQKVSW